MEKVRVGDWRRPIKDDHMLPTTFRDPICARREGIEFSHQHTTLVLRAQCNSKARLIKIGDAGA